MISLDEKFLALYGRTSGGDICIFKLQSGQLYARLKSTSAFESGVVSVSFGSDSRRVVSAIRNQNYRYEVALWDLDSRTRIWKSQPGITIEHVTFSPQNDLIACLLLSHF